MACLVPRTIVNPRYRKIAPLSHAAMYHPDGGKYPKNDYYVQIDCNRCINCFKKYMSAWRFRLLHEILSLDDAARKKTYFVTLTIEPKYYTEKKPLLKQMVRRFLERARKFSGKSIRHFLVTERGEDKNRLHFHGFFINTDIDPARFYQLWYYGFVYVIALDSGEHTVSQKIGYCTTYVTKGRKGELPMIMTPEDMPLVLVSPGLGKAYADKYKHVHHQGVLFPMAFDISGSLRSLPRYLRQKVFTEKELRKLKNDYFDNYSDDVIPDGPYYIGERMYEDYSEYLEARKAYERRYKLIYKPNF